MPYPIRPPIQETSPSLMNSKKRRKQTRKNAEAILDTHKNLRNVRQREIIFRDCQDHGTSSVSELGFCGAVGACRRARRQAVALTGETYPCGWLSRYGGAKGCCVLREAHRLRIWADNSGKLHPLPSHGQKRFDRLLVLLQIA